MECNNNRDCLPFGVLEVPLWFHKTKCFSFFWMHWMPTFRGAAMTQKPLLHVTMALIRTWISTSLAMDIVSHLTKKSMASSVEMPSIFWISSIIQVSIFIWYAHSSPDYKLALKEFTEVRANILETVRTDWCCTCIYPCRWLAVFLFLLAMHLASSTPDTGLTMTLETWCV